MQHRVPRSKTLLLSVLCVTPCLQGFVLLSGPREARLDVSPQDGVAEFIISDEIPSISGKSTFLDGKYADLDDEEFWRALIREAMAPWNDVSSSYITMQLSDDAGATKSPDDRVHSIVVEKVNLSSAAYATPKIDDDKIIDCDITISSKKTDAKSLAYTMMHELGHCLGLGHNHTNYDAVMGYARENDELRLGLDDKAGITFLYPDPGLDSPSETLGCASLGKHAKSSNPMLLVLMMLLPLCTVLFSLSRRLLHPSIRR
jgi:hypothetical protein